MVGSCALDGQRAQISVTCNRGKYFFQRFGNVFLHAFFRAKKSALQVTQGERNGLCR